METVTLWFMDEYDVIVIGAGASGLLAAGRAGELGARVLVLEKMRQEGRKLLITGKGRCNITNDAAISEFIRHVYPNGRFLKKAFSRFYSKDILQLLQDHGVETVLERGGRYFPESNKSADVLNALLKWVKSYNVEIKCGFRVEKIFQEQGEVTGLKANGITYKTRKVILATGGKSYPATGSAGDGYELAGTLGHSLEKPHPGLVPVETAGETAQKMQGLNLKNVNVVVRINQKKEGEAFGELLFTHFGLSGPVILTLSRLMVEALRDQKKVEVSIDLKPALDEKKLDAKLIRELNENGRKKLGNIFKNWLPSSMIPVFIEVLELNPEKECHQVSGKERKSIRHLMKNLSFLVTGHRSFKEAIITSGGIPLNEINSKTMESKLVKGLYFAGEMIDLDAETGGYNLQIAFSTGWVSGDSSVKSLDQA